MVTYYENVCVEQNPYNGFIEVRMESDSHAGQSAERARLVGIIPGNRLAVYESKDGQQATWDGRVWMPIAEKYTHVALYNKEANTVTIDGKDYPVSKPAPQPKDAPEGGMLSSRGTDILILWTDERSSFDEELKVENINLDAPCLIQFKDQPCLIALATYTRVYASEKEDSHGPDPFVFEELSINPKAIRSCL